MDRKIISEQEASEAEPNSSPVLCYHLLLIKFFTTGKYCWLGESLLWLNKEMRESPAPSLTVSV